MAFWLEWREAYYGCLYACFCEDLREFIGESNLVVPQADDVWLYCADDLVLILYCAKYGEVNVLGNCGEAFLFVLYRRSAFDVLYCFVSCNHSGEVVSVFARLAKEINVAWVHSIKCSEHKDFFHTGVNVLLFISVYASFLNKELLLVL
jgi:hypothetical protein